MFLVFRLTLATEKQHSYNRGVILSIYTIAFLALPMMHIIKGLFHKTNPMALPDLTVIATSAGASEYNAPLWGTVLIWIYIIGMAVMAAKTVITFTNILKVIAGGEKIRKDGYTLALTNDESLSPFSWMRFVVMSRKDYEECGETITDHELRHIGLFHWIDLLVAQAVIIINWFNPAAWLMREDLMLIHEYQADMAVIDSGHNAKEYQMLLIKKAVGSRFPSLANSLNHSKLKKRITMMYQEKSGKGRRLKALALVPAIAVALAATSIPQVQAAMSTIANSATSVSKVTDNPANAQTQSPQIQAVDSVPSQDRIKVIGYGTIKKDESGNCDPNNFEFSAGKLTADTIKVRCPADAEPPVIFVGDKEITHDEMLKINPSDIESIEVFKEPVNKIVITLKK